MKTSTVFWLVILFLGALIGAITPVLAQDKTPRIELEDLFLIDDADAVVGVNTVVCSPSNKNPIRLQCEYDDSRDQGSATLQANELTFVYQFHDLEKAWEEKAEGKTFVVPRFRDEALRLAKQQYRRHTSKVLRKKCESANSRSSLRRVTLSKNSKVTLGCKRVTLMHLGSQK